MYPHLDHVAVHSSRELVVTEAVIFGCIEAQGYEDEVRVVGSHHWNHDRLEGNKVICIGHPLIGGAEGNVDVEPCSIPLPNSVKGAVLSRGKKLLRARFRGMSGNRKCSDKKITTGKTLLVDGKEEWVVCLVENLTGPVPRADDVITIKR